MKKNRKRTEPDTGNPGKVISSQTSTESKSNQTRALEHAAVGYKNAQDIIRFLDTKTTFLTGATTLTIGVVLQAIRQFVQMPVDLRHTFDNHPYPLFFLIVIIEVSLFFGVLSLWSSVWSLAGRPPQKKMDCRATVLFPYFSGTSEDRSFCKQALEGMSERDIANEYASQILNVGLILQEKFIRHRTAIRMFLAQLVTLVFAGGIVLYCIS